MTPKKAFERYLEFIDLFGCNAEDQLGSNTTHESLVALAKAVGVTDFKKCPWYLCDHYDLSVDPKGKAERSA